MQSQKTARTKIVKYTSAYLELHANNCRSRYANASNATAILSVRLSVTLSVCVAKLVPYLININIGGINVRHHF